MGYTGKNHWAESDSASDFFNEFTTSILKSFKKRRRDGHLHDNEFNTRWYEDIAMVIETTLLESAEQFLAETELLEFLTMMVKEFDKSDRDQKRMHDNIVSFIDRCEKAK